MSFIDLNRRFFKSYFGDQLLSTKGHEASNHILVIVYTIVDIENENN